MSHIEVKSYSFHKRIDKNQNLTVASELHNRSERFRYVQTCNLRGIDHRRDLCRPQDPRAPPPSSHRTMLCPLELKPRLAPEYTPAVWTPEPSQGDSLASVGYRPIASTFLPHPCRRSDNLPSIESFRYSPFEPLNLWSQSRRWWKRLCQSLTWMVYINRNYCLSDSYRSENIWFRKTVSNRYRDPLAESEYPRLSWGYIFFGEGLEIIRQTIVNFFERERRRAID